MRLLFVCHANLCRSPLAHGVMVHLLRGRGLEHEVEVDSAGTWASEGIAPHPESARVARVHGIDLTPAGRSRGVVPDDLARFDEILAMDRRNEADLLRFRRLSAFGPVEGGEARIRLLRHVVQPHAMGRAADVPDPIGGGPSAYDEVFALVHAACTRWIEAWREAQATRGTSGAAG